MLEKNKIFSFITNPNCPNLLNAQWLKELKEDGIIEILIDNQTWLLTAQQIEYDKQNSILQKSPFESHCKKIEKLTNLTEPTESQKNLLAKTYYGQVTNKTQPIVRKNNSRTSIYTTLGILAALGITWYYNPGSITDLCKSFFNNWWNGPIKK